MSRTRGAARPSNENAPQRHANVRGRSDTNLPPGHAGEAPASSPPLEAEPSPWLPGPANRWGTLAIVILSAGVALFLNSILFGSPHASRTTTPPSTTPSVSPSPTIQSERYTNDVAGYSFVPPAGWIVSESDTVSELVSPDGEVVISFGLAPSGSLEDAAAEFRDSIADSYDTVDLHVPERGDVSGHRAFITGGNLTNAAGVPLRFLALTLRLGGDNYAISVFVAESADPLRVLPSVEDVIASFHVA